MHRVDFMFDSPAEYGIKPVIEAQRRENLQRRLQESKKAVEGFML